jgi:hypothetical protein
MVIFAIGLLTSAQSYESTHLFRQKEKKKDVFGSHFLAAAVAVASAIWLCAAAAYTQCSSSSC